VVIILLLDEERGRKVKLMDPTTHKDWLLPHSKEWYAQLGNMYGKYSYQWNSTLTESNGETIFDEGVLQVAKNKKVLDVGCGHGAFTLHCSTVAKEIVGFDVTDDFVRTGNENRKKHVRFVQGDSKKPLPFEREEFDVAYIRKGPTSAYPSLANVVKKGGAILGLHPGDQGGIELSSLFPYLYEPYPEGTPILDLLKERLERSSFAHAEIEAINSEEWLDAPLDVLKLRCFGQHPSIYNMIVEENLEEVTNIFEKHRAEKGLCITFSRYLVRATV
jgi:SAM-dependent methyltransferase